MADLNKIVLYGTRNGNISEKQERKIFSIVDGIIALSEHPDAFGKVFNLGGTGEVSMRDLAERIIAITGSSSPLEFISYDVAYEDGFEDMQRRVPSISRAQKLVGFAPTVGLDDMIRSVINDQQG